LPKVPDPKKVHKLQLFQKRAITYGRQSRHPSQKWRSADTSIVTSLLCSGFANNGTVVVGDATIVVTIYNTTNLWMPWRVSKNTITVGIACFMYYRGDKQTIDGFNFLNGKSSLVAKVCYSYCQKYNTATNELVNCILASFAICLILYYLIHHRVILKI
jgi:hypothetical protein